MLDTSQPSAHTGSRTRVAVVSTYPPARCGIARFSSSLVDALTLVDRQLDVGVIRLTCGADELPSYGPVVMQIDPNSAVGIRAARRHLESCDVVVLQHEFGIFGSDDGASVVDLIEGLSTPAIVVLHTVLSEPTPAQRSIIRALVDSCTVVALCRSAERLLVEGYGLASSGIEVIPHGAHWSPQPANHQPRRQLMTWGLLGPGKGLERAIEALAMLRDIDPPVTYCIVGRTHPVVAARRGFEYRKLLEDRVDELGLSGSVEFIDRYVDDHELFDMARRSDVVVVPYDNSDQISSGVITEAVGMARPVVATRFPYSEEVLGSGAGIVVDHDPGAIAAAIRDLVEDPIVYRRAVREATRISEDLNWALVARKYSHLIREVSPTAATA